MERGSGWAENWGLYLLGKVDQNLDLRGRRDSLEVAGVLGRRTVVEKQVCVRIKRNRAI